MGMLEQAGPIDRDAYRGVFGRVVAAHRPAEVQNMSVAAGFPDAAVCVQIAAVRGWLARRA
jgi:hypothetical protein